MSLSDVANDVACQAWGNVLLFDRQATRLPPLSARLAPKRTAALGPHCVRNMAVPGWKKGNAMRRLADRAAAAGRATPAGAPGTMGVTLPRLAEREDKMDDSKPALPGPVRRHRVSTRLWHWTNALCVYLLLASGPGIFNAHPRLYWGEYGANFDHAWLTLQRFGGAWTLPGHYDLAMSRRWHLSLALVFGVTLLAYLLWSLANRHVGRDLAFRRGELAPRHVWREIRDHARLRFPTGMAALRYNVLQKASYIGVIFILLPLMILTGLAMSPGMDAAWPWLTGLLGGRQSARSIHFIAAWLLVAFFVVHIVMVLLAGPLSGMRAMVTGWYRPPPPRDREPAA